jgi:hypothetical protein
MSVLELLVVSFAWASQPVAPARQCEGPDVDPWVTDFRSRVESYDALYQLAADRYGPPTECEGTVTMEFDGARFGSLVLGFPGGVTFAVETMPPESSVTTLRAPGAFEEPELVRRGLEDYASGRGLAIDWSTPEISEDAGEVIHTFWAPEPGLNASASLIFSGDALVGVRMSMAL